MCSKPAQSHLNRHPLQYPLQSQVGIVSVDRSKVVAPGNAGSSLQQAYSDACFTDSNACMNRVSKPGQFLERTCARIRFSSFQHRSKQFVHSSLRQLPGGNKDFGRRQFDFDYSSKTRRSLTGDGLGEPCRTAVRPEDHPSPPEPTRGGKRVQSVPHRRRALGPVLPQDAVRVGQ